MTPRFQVLQFALLAITVAGCGAPDGPSVLLVTLDTTRDEYFGAYGHPDARTPWVDRLARSGATFETAVADVPVTLPSHTTLMTGLPALAHGVRYNSDFKLSERASTLAEVFADQGYATGATVSSLVLDAEFGLQQGFEHYDDDLTPGYVKHDESKYPPPTHWLPKADRRAGETVSRAIDWHKKVRGPYFSWVHFYDPHFPFDPPPPWDDTASDSYLAEIQYTDRELGRLVKLIELDSREVIVVVTADHGEGLDQHREDGHGIFIYDETLRIPLVVSAPGRIERETVVPDQVRSIDVASTLLELTNLHDDDFGWGGSLVPLLEGTGGAPDSVAYCESIKTRLFYGGTGLKALRTQTHKYVWAPRPELYALDTDPGETQNLLEGTEDGTWRSSLEAIVAELLEFESLAEAADVDERTLEGLRSLGYLSGGESTGPRSVTQEMGLVGHDPKDLVDVSMGAREIQNGFVERAEKKLRRFFATARPPSEENMQRLWAAAHQNYAKIWMLRKEFALAAEQYSQAVAADSSYREARWSQLYALNRAGASSLAIARGERLLESFPKDWSSRFHFGIAHALEGRTNDAQQALQRILDEAPESERILRNVRYFHPRLGTAEERDALRNYLGEASTTSES